MASAKSAAQKKAAEAEATKTEGLDAAVQNTTPGAVTGSARKPTTEPPVAHKSAPEPSLSPKAATKLAAKRQTGTHDLFAAVDKAGSEIDVDTSDAEAHEPVKATGARNENSVLFSLDALKSGMLGGPTSGASAQPAPTGPRKKAPGPPTRRLEDLMAVDVPGPAFGGGGSLGGGGLLLSGNDALLAAPPPPPPPKPEPKPEPVHASSTNAPVAPPRKSRLGVVIALAIALVALGAGGAFLALKSSDKEAKPEASAAAATGALAAVSAPTTPTAVSAAPSTASSAPSEVAKNEADAAVHAAGSSAPAQAVAVAKPGGGASRPITGKSNPSDAKPVEKKPDAKSAEPASAGGGGGFNKEAAVAALSVAASQATVCKRPEGPWGSGRAVVTFASSGRVTTANVTGEPFGGTAVGGCVASVFRRAKIPGFSGDPVTVSKSFTIAP
jgi:hypothetical protein